MIHERHLRRCGWSKRTKISAAPPPARRPSIRLRRARRPAVVAQDAEAHAVHVERVCHGSGSDLPDLRRSELGRDVDPVHIERAAVDPHHLGSSGMVVTGGGPRQLGSLASHSPFPSCPCPIPIPIMGSSTSVLRAIAALRFGDASVVNCRGSRVIAAFNAGSGLKRMKVSVAPVRAGGPFASSSPGPFRDACPAR